MKISVNAALNLCSGQRRFLLAVFEINKARNIAFMCGQ